MHGPVVYATVKFCEALLKDVRNELSMMLITHAPSRTNDQCIFFMSLFCKCWKQIQALKERSCLFLSATPNRISFWAFIPLRMDLICYDIGYECSSKTPALKTCKTPLSRTHAMVDIPSLSSHNQQRACQLEQCKFWLASEGELGQEKGCAAAHVANLKGGLCCGEELLPPKTRRLVQRS